MFEFNFSATIAGKKGRYTIIKGMSFLRGREFFEPYSSNTSLHFLKSTDCTGGFRCIV